MSETAAQPLPLRSEVPVEHRWNLDVFFETLDDWNATYDKTEALLPSISTFQGRLSEGPEVLKGYLSAFFSIRGQILELYFFAMLKSDEDTTNSAHTALRQRAMGLRSRLDEVSAFFRPELLGLSQETLDDYLTSDALEPFRFRLENIVREKLHTLSPQEEQLLASAGQVLQGPYEIFAQIMSSDLDFGAIQDEDGEDISLTESRYASLLQKPQRALRERAFRAYYETYKRHQHGFSATLCNSVRASTFEARARHFESARASALFDDNIPEKVYDNLVEAVNDRLPALHRYHALRARLLGLEKLAPWDFQVPIIPEANAHHSYEDAVGLIVSSLAPLGTEYTQTLAKGLLEGRWVDRYENQGKRPGAYSAGCYRKPPLILMNYQPDNIRAVFTLAHEAGHSMHSWYSQREQPRWDSRYSIFVAEVASTFNETLLTEHLLKQTDDPKQRAYLLNYELGAINSTLFRQTMFAEYEHQLHLRDEQRKSLSLQDMTQLYHDHLERYHGQHIELDPLLDVECLRVPHFYFGFYVYKYATGLSAALALARRVLDGGAEARDDYLRFLSAGGSVYPLDALKAAGVDMTARAPVDAALDHFERRLEELEQHCMSPTS